MKIQNYKNKKIYFLLIVMLITVVILLWFFLIRTNDSSPKPQPGSVADVSKPTEDEKKSGDIQKEKNVERQKLDNSSPESSKKSVNPIITYAQQFDSNIEVAAFVGDVYENGGTCTLTAVQGQNKVIRENPAQKSVKTTDCLKFILPTTSFASKGTWKVSVAYKSSVSEGTSQSVDFEVK